jgi:hypothetical protein
VEATQEPNTTLPREVVALVGSDVRAILTLDEE